MSSLARKDLIESSGTWKSAVVYESPGTLRGYRVWFCEVKVGEWQTGFVTTACSAVVGILLLRWSVYAVISGLWRTYVGK